MTFSWRNRTFAPSKFLTRSHFSLKAELIDYCTANYCRNELGNDLLCSISIVFGFVLVSYHWIFWASKMYESRERITHALSRSAFKFEKLRVYLAINHRFSHIWRMYSRVSPRLFSSSKCYWLRSNSYNQNIAMIKIVENRIDSKACDVVVSR